MTKHKIIFAWWANKPALEIEANTFAEAITGAKDNLRGADLRGADLRNANLRYADLSDADLSDANLCGAVFADGWMIVKAEGRE